jgi:hypothetical protein
LELTSGAGVVPLEPVASLKRRLGGGDRGGRRHHRQP